MGKWRVILGVFALYYVTDSIYLWLAKGDPWALKSLFAGIVFGVVWLQQRSDASRRKH